jgi:hypothetical protein
MTEKLFQYIWQFQYFNKSELQTYSGEKLEIIFQGVPNVNQGPDFLNAQIKIANTILVGSIELHLKTSQWHDHGHDLDQNYKNVILHVVFEHDTEETKHPILELQSRISKMLLHRYSSLMDATSFVSCANSIDQVKEIVWMSWKERLLAERLTRKSQLIFQFLEQNNFHWEETFWWMLARNFGIKVNSDGFEAIARSISINILAKHKSQIHQLEALLLGQAGLLNKEFIEEYPKLLKREYQFLQKKYNLSPIHIPIHFLRMRPGNFPTIRLAQLAILIQNSANLFSRIIETEQLEDIKEFFLITANDYWHYHYIMDELSGFRKKTLGGDMINNLIINTVVTFLFAYGMYHKKDCQKNRAIHWLEELEAESNSITKGFKQLKLVNTSAFDSQAFIELKTQYCDQKRCLSCAIGNGLLRKGSD